MEQILALIEKWIADSEYAELFNIIKGIAEFIATL